MQAPLSSAAADACRSLEKIDVDEPELFSRTEQQQLFTHFLGSCIDADLIRRLLVEIPDFCIGRGCVTTRPYLVERNIGDAQIEIRVLTGIIEAIIDAGSGAGNGRITTAFAFSGDDLNLRELDNREACGEIYGIGPNDQPAIARSTEQNTGSRVLRKAPTISFQRWPVAPPDKNQA